jgi:hypothetical protein
VKGFPFFPLPPVEPPAATEVLGPDWAESLGEVLRGAFPAAKQPEPGKERRWPQ